MKDLVSSTVESHKFKDLYGIYRGLKTLDDKSFQDSLGEYQVEVSQKGLDLSLATEDKIISREVPILDLNRMSLQSMISMYGETDILNNIVGYQNLRTGSEFIFNLDSPNNGIGLVIFSGKALENWIYADFFFNPRQIENGAYLKFLEELGYVEERIKKNICTLDNFLGVPLKLV